MLERINSKIPECVRRFNDAKIRLHNQRRLFKFKYDNPELPVDKVAFLETMKHCSWHGPFKNKGHPRYSFCTINGAGDNQNFVMVEVGFYPHEWILVHTYCIRTSLAELEQY